MTDLDQVRDGLHLSVSQLRTYLRCPRSFELRYVLGARPAFRPVPLAFGSSFHSSLAKFYVTVKEAGAPPPLGLLADSFRDAWARELDDDIPLQSDEDEPDDKAAVVDKGVEMLGVFHAHATKNLDDVSVEAVEAPFDVSLVDPDTGVEMEERLVGVLDLVLKKGRRRLIYEHKTSARKYTEDQIRWDLQRAGTDSPRRRWGSGTSTSSTRSSPRAGRPRSRSPSCNATTTTSWSSSAWRWA